MFNKMNDHHKFNNIIQLMYNYNHNDNDTHNEFWPLVDVQFNV